MYFTPLAAFVAFFVSPFFWYQRYSHRLPLIFITPLMIAQAAAMPTAGAAQRDGGGVRSDAAGQCWLIFSAG